MIPLPEGPFEIIYADPPWQYKSCVVSGSRATDHYPTMPTAEMETMPVAGIAAPDSLLFMWATSPLLEDALRLGGAWGFKYATVAFQWVKDRPVAGSYTMSQTEPCLVFRRGRIPKPRGPHNIRQILEAPVRRHSAKPEEARRRIEVMFPRQRKVELFARVAAHGWTAWGNQAPAEPEPDPFDYLFG